MVKDQEKIMEEIEKDRMRMKEMREGDKTAE